MNYEDIRERVTTLINEAWVVEYPTNKLVFENHESPDIEQYRKMFAEVKIRIDDAYQSAMMGSNSPYRMVGRVELDIYSPGLTGSKEATEVFDFLTSLMSLTEVSGIVFKVPRPVASLKAVGWFRMSGVAPFYAESFTS